MRSNSKAVREPARAYLLECINDFDLESGKDDTLKNRLQEISDDFNGAKNYPYNVKRYHGNTFEIWVDWLRGLPTSLPIYTGYTEDCIKALESWGLPNKPEYHSDQSERLFFHILFSELNKLYKENGLELWQN